MTAITPQVWYRGSVSIRGEQEHFPRSGDVSLVPGWVILRSDDFNPNDPQMVWFPADRVLRVITAETPIPEGKRGRDMSWNQ